MYGCCALCAQGEVADGQALPAQERGRNAPEHTHTVFVRFTQNHTVHAPRACMRCTYTPTALCARVRVCASLATACAYASHATKTKCVCCTTAVLVPEQRLGARQEAVRVRSVLSRAKCAVLVPEQRLGATGGSARAKCAVLVPEQRLGAQQEALPTQLQE
jgi:hypothetical protein